VCLFYFSFEHWRAHSYLSTLLWKLHWLPWSSFARHWHLWQFEKTNQIFKLWHEISNCWHTWY
jgi:hypothetical protein